MLHCASASAFPGCGKNGSRRFGASRRSALRPTCWPNARLPAYPSPPDDAPGVTGIADGRGRAHLGAERNGRRTPATASPARA
eukprot:6581493-Alexandrium_andersonii.AAC.1